MYRIRPLASAGTDSSGATRAALIEAASPLFAELGFESTRIRDIADRAHANVAAINYHFGSKMGLYQAVLKAQSEQMIASFPLQTPDVEQASPEERLHWLVKNILRRVLGSSEKDRPTRMCVREFVEPTEALDYLVKETVAAQHAITRSVVTAVAGRELPEEELSRHAISLVSQCIYYGLAEPMLTRLGIRIPRTESEIDELAAHITRFSLAGIRTA
ncbi:MAG: CerR family C-terminal domain-containing protein [Gammaproteobacteria bacterium]